MMLIYESCPTCRLYFRKAAHLFTVDQQSQCNLRAAQDGKVGCNTISYMASFAKWQKLSYVSVNFYASIALKNDFWVNTKRTSGVKRLLALET